MRTAKEYNNAGSPTRITFIPLNNLDSLLQFCSPWLLSKKSAIRQKKLEYRFGAPRFNYLTWSVKIETEIQFSLLLSSGIKRTNLSHKNKS